MTADEIRRELAMMAPWHHNVELAPGVWTNPRMGNHPAARWALVEPHVPKDLRGKTVLDLGCSSGFFSAMLKKRGAERVVAVDVADSAIREAHLLARVFDTQLEIVKQDMYDFLIENRASFDYVLFLGAFYHLRSPLFVLDRLAKLTRERMYFQTWVRNEGVLLAGARRLLFACYEMGVLAKRGEFGRALTSAWRTVTRPLVFPDNIAAGESHLLSHPDFPKMSFIRNSTNGDRTNWWVTDTHSLREILESAGFQRVRQLSDDAFICDNAICAERLGSGT